MKTLSLVIIALASFVGRSYCQSQLVSDNFNGTNGTSLGSNWTGCGYNNGAYNKLVYESNAAGGGGYWGQDCALYTGYGAFPSDQYATATVVAPTPSSTRQASVQIRANATAFSDEAYIACGWDAQDFPVDFHYRIWSLAPGAPGPVSLWLSSIVPAVNDVITCQVLGNTVSMTLNGQVVAVVTDTSGNNTGYPGLYYVDPNGTGPSAADVIFANFQAGSGPPVVSTQITPPSATVPAGSFVQYSGIVKYADGTTATISNWSSSDSSVATVDMTGTAFGANAGIVTVTGTSGPDTVTAMMTVVAGDGYTPLVHDTFVGAGGPYLGSNWTGCGYDGGGYSKLVYQNNEAGGGGYGSQDCALYTGMGVFPADQFATATIVAAVPLSTPEASIELRGNASPGLPESYIACGWNAQDFPSYQHYRIWSLPPNGTPTSLYLSTITPTTNDVIWCQVLGNTVTMLVNGTALAVVSDSSGLSSGYPGLFYIDPNQDVPPITDVIFDNFAAGSVDHPVIASVAVSPTSSTTTVNSSVQFAATGIYTDGTMTTVTNAVTWSSSNSAVATINTSGLATGVGTGTATITATSGTANGVASLAVYMLTPTVAFTGVPSTAPYLGVFTITATTNAPVMPTINGSVGVCSVGAVTGTPAAASAVVTMLSGTGTCTLTANWPAGGNYAAAGPLTKTTTATRIAPTVTFTGAPASNSYGATFNVTATTNASTMPQITGSPGICTVGAVSGTPANAGAVVTMSSATGTCTLTASWNADANYSSPSPLTQSTTATKATSTTAIVSNTPNPSTLNQAVVISFLVAGVGTRPTGSVSVNASTGESCKGTLSSGAGSCSITFSKTGTRTLTASYGGDSYFNSSTSSGVSQAVSSPPAVGLSSPNINFGNVSRGSSQTKSETVSNTGTSALTNLSWSITGANADQFTVSSTTCGTPPTTLNPGASCVINVTFSPTQKGTLTGSLILTDNAANSPQTVGLSASGK